MGTKRSQKNSEPLSVSDPKKVLALCANDLKSILDTQELEFRIIQQDSDRHIFALYTTTNYLITTDSQGNKHQIIALFSTESNRYWLNISLTFLLKFSTSKQKNRPENFQFSGVSVRIFKGLITERKDPVLRAEWDTLKDDNNHAQPHWHIYKSFQSRNLQTAQDSDFESFIAPNDLQDFGNEEENQSRNDWDSSTKFHFAMASQWHDKGSHRIVLNNETQLKNWLVECVRYIKEQLLYVEGKK